MTILKHFLFLILFFSSSLVVAQQQSQSVFRFLELNADARTAALGGGHSALLHPQSTQFTINPALLHSSDVNNLHFSYLNHLSDINYGTANYAHYVTGIGKIAASARYLNYGDMTGYDEEGNELGSVSANDVAFSTGWASQLSEDIHYGLAASMIYSSLAGYRSTAASFSGGLLYDMPNRNTSFGASVTNAGTQLTTYNGISEQLPLNISAGIVHQLQYLPLRLHVTFKKLNQWQLEDNAEESSPPFLTTLTNHMLVGAEILMGERVTTRIGYDRWLHNQAETGKRIDGAGLSFGVALELNRISVDFSRTSFSDLGSVVQLGIGLPLIQNQ